VTTGSYELQKNGKWREKKRGDMQASEAGISSKSGEIS
jgi:hypothetical protein